MRIDLSFMPTLQCNLACSFCMYDCSIAQTDKLDMRDTEKFIDTVDWTQINSVGFYGGEISINMKLYQRFIDLIPKDVPRFTITNGTWSNTKQDIKEFLLFIITNRLYTYVSTTPEHRAWQNLENLHKTVADYKPIMCFKGDDTQERMNPMGRLYRPDWKCTQKCKRVTYPDRLAIMPDGNIIYQSCDGVYPIVADYTRNFSQVSAIINKKDFCMRM